jgi:hypothetical protein
LPLCFQQFHMGWPGNELRLCVEIFLHRKKLNKLNVNSRRFITMRTRQAVYV